MLASNLVVAGTVVYYDDVGVIKADEGGELLAHEQMTAKYGVTWRRLHDSCWQVLGVGGRAAGASASAE